MTLYIVDPAEFLKTAITQSIMQAPGDEVPTKDNYRGLTLEEYKVAVNNPNLVAMTWDELMPLHEQYKEGLQGPWEEISQKDYNFAMDCLPPQRMRDLSDRFRIFYMQEAYTADLHSHYVWDRREQKYYKVLRSKFTKDAQFLIELTAI